MTFLFDERKIFQYIRKQTQQDIDALTLIEIIGLTLFNPKKSVHIS